MEDRLSTLEVGKLADVFVVEGNPLEGFDALSSAVSPPQAKWSSGQRSLPGPPRRQGNADLWSAPLREAQREACTAQPPG